METIKAACPKCKKHFPIELPDGRQFFTVAACDHCGHEKRVSVFVKELERQRLAPMKKEQERLRVLADAENLVSKEAKRKENKRLKAEAREEREASRHHQEQLRQQWEAQENQADSARLNTGGGCPRCGSIQNKTVTKATGGDIQAVGLLMMLLACVSLCVPILGWALTVIFGSFGCLLVLMGCFRRETKLRCLKCGFER